MACPGARTAASAPLVKEGGAFRTSAPFHRSRGPSAPACTGASGAARRLPAIETIHEHVHVDPPDPSPIARGLTLVRPGWAAALLRDATGRRFTAQGARVRLSPHRPRPGKARTSYPETDSRRAPLFMSPPRDRLEEPAACDVAAAKTRSPASPAHAGSAPDRPLARPIRRAVRRAAPAKGKPGSPRPRCLSTEGDASSASGLSHRLSPTCGDGRVPRRRCDQPPSTTAARHQRRERSAGRTVRRRPLPERRALVALPRLLRPMRTAARVSQA